MNPVVFFDSGVGGLAYFSQVRTSVSHDYLYVADTRMFPYGNKTAPMVFRALTEYIRTLQTFCEPKLIVLACNTASTMCLGSLRDVFPDIPFVGTVPAIKPATASGGSIVLLSSKQTAKEQYTQELITEFAAGSTIIPMLDDSLIQAIEEDFPNLDSLQVQSAFQESVKRIQKSGADSVILACTHFLHLKDAFIDALPTLSIFDSLTGIVKRIKTLVDGINTKTTVHLYTSSVSPRYEHIAEQLDMEYQGVL